jgi:hypothetical protein
MSDFHTIVATNAFSRSEAARYEHGDNYPYDQAPRPETGVHCDRHIAEKFKDRAPPAGIVRPRAHGRGASGPVK